MIFRACRVPGAFLVEAEPRGDERGSFATVFSEDVFRAQGLDARVSFCAVARNARRGTLRGMHYQEPPHEQAKLVRCIRGTIYDVIVDLRGDSPTRGQWEAFELSSAGHSALYVPPGMAHGYLTLEDESDVFYQISAPYVPASERGVRWDDPSLGITWPEQPIILSERDRALPYLVRDCCQ